MPLTDTAVAVVIIGAVLPLTPAAGALGFGTLPPAYYLFLVGQYVSAIVEVVKRPVMQRVLPGAIGQPAER